MKTLGDYLDMAAAITGSDYQTAKRLNITRSSVSKCRSEGTMKTANVVALAELIGVNPAEIVAACDIAKNPENARIWAKWGALAGVTLAAFAAAIFVENQAVTTAFAFAPLSIMRTVIFAVLIALVWFAWSRQVSYREA